MEDRIPERALVVSAHPDDLDFGCNGTVTLWTRAGCKVSYVICTNGDKGAEDPKIPDDVLSDIRKREQTEAAQTAGVNDVFFLGVEDGELENTKELRGRLVEIVRMVRPEIVFCQDPANLAFENAFVSHSDHRAAAQATFDALYPAAGNSRFFPELLVKGLEPYHVGRYSFSGPMPRTIGRYHGSDGRQTESPSLPCQPGRGQGRPGNVHPGSFPGNGEKGGLRIRGSIPPPASSLGSADPE